MKSIILLLCKECFNFRIVLLILTLFFGTNIQSQSSFECEVLADSVAINRYSNPCMYFSDLTKEQILSMPLHNVSVVFHFRGNNQGQNFTCDPNDPIVQTQFLLYVPTFVFHFLDEINSQFSMGVEIEGEKIDSRLRFNLANGDACSSSYFYNHDENFDDIDNVLNIHIYDAQGSGSAIMGYYKYVNIHAGVNHYLSSNNTWEPARTCIHEFGHTLDLDHTFYCDNPCATENDPNGDYSSLAECNGMCRECQHQGCGSGCFGSSDGYAMGYGHGNVKFGICEYTKLMNYIIDDAPPSIDNCNNLNSIDQISIDNGGFNEWNGLKKINSDIVIENNSTLLISCATIELGENVKILVESGSKLIIDNSRLTNNCSSNYWSGIKIAGGNPDFDIEIKNSSIIENTNEAAITMWPTDYNNQPANGIAQIEYSTFNNVKGVVGFYAKSSSFNPSFVKYCTINNAKWGISNTNCQRVVVQNNQFNNVQNECIYSNNGSYNITGNTFESQQVDILFTNTVSGLSSTITDNTFNGSNTGYKSMAPSFGQDRLNENQFNNPQINVINDGHNSFIAEKNRFRGDMGVLSFDNGFGNVEVKANSFLGNFIGILAIGQNNSFNFFENCFSSHYSDVYIDGSVSDVIHNYNQPANNCFTHQGNSFSSILDISGNMSPLLYLEPEGDEIDCRDAIKADPNVVTRVQDGMAVMPECADGFTIPPSPIITNPCFPGESEAEITAAIAWLEAKIEEIQNNPNLNQIQKDKLIGIYERCLGRLEGILSEMYAEDGQYDEAIALFENDNSTEARISIFSLHVQSNDLITAREFLLNENENSEEWNDFVNVQLVNLSMLNAIEFEPTNIQLTDIEVIARKNSPISVYAKSLFYILTGELIESELPEFANNRTRNNITKVKALDITVSPNPFTNKLSVEMSKACEIEVFNAVGQTIFEVNSDSKIIDINTENWNQGFYIVVFKENGNIVHKEKVISTNLR